MRQCSRRLLRIARVVLKDDFEAEAALRDAYVAAYLALKESTGSNLSTWITRILIDEALKRLNTQDRDRVVIPFVNARDNPPETEQPAAIGENRTTAEDATLRAEIRALLERKIDELPLALRTVFVMRELEAMTVAETAECLGIHETTVRSRLSQARSLFRTSIECEIDLVLPDVFAFGGERCERTVEAVLGRITNDANHNLT